MMADIEKARWSQARGAILLTLKDDYAHEMTSVASLIRVLDAQGVSLSHKDISFHLRYLSDQGYARIWRARDLPGFRRDRLMDVKPEMIMFAQMQPRGLQLIDGQIDADPAVAF